MSEIEKLAEEVKQLRERVAVLEHRLSQPVRDGFPVWQPIFPQKYGDPIPCANPYVVTC